MQKCSLESKLHKILYMTKKKGKINGIQDPIWDQLSEFKEASWQLFSVVRQTLGGAP